MKWPTRIVPPLGGAVALWEAAHAHPRPVVLFAGLMVAASGVGKMLDRMWRDAERPADHFEPQPLDRFARERARAVREEIGVEELATRTDWLIAHPGQDGPWDHPNPADYLGGPPVAPSRAMMSREEAIRLYSSDADPFEVDDAEFEEIVTDNGGRIRIDTGTGRRWFCDRDGHLFEFGGECCVKCGARHRM